MRALTQVIQPDGNVSLPAEVLDALHVKVCSKLMFLVEEGRVVLKPLPEINVATLHMVVS